ncbi:hypothetical protein, partial [Providencia stuartii]|uniref:hypothetical protein n=1 Tax=Providencia stuartii TaxID=588 RepID=UPI002989EFCA
GCNPAYSKSIQTWLRFGEIMRGSLSIMHRFPMVTLILVASATAYADTCDNFVVDTGFII